MGAVVQQVGEVLGRAHSLFGDPPSSGGSAAAGAGNKLSGAGDLVRDGQSRISGLSGQFATSYGVFAGGAGPALDNLAGTDQQLSNQLREAAGSDRGGRATSGAVVNGAAADTAGLAPFSSTPAGQKALLTALRSRVAQQQQVVQAYKARSAKMAALMRSLAYARGNRLGGGSLISPSGFGGGSGGGLGAMPGLSALSGGLSGLVNQGRNPRTALAANHRIPPGLPPLGSLTSWSSPREVAAVIIREALRRGYSPAQTIAILSTAMQESGLDPKAVSPNRLWKNIFQQDASYKGRDDPNTAIAEFFNRLATKGGPASPDIWKSIFWLQQAPGASSAEAAYANGQGYLSEIRSELRRAQRMYNQLTSAPSSCRVSRFVAESHD